MDVIRIVSGSDRDLDILAAFNQQLIEDTKHDNGMTVDQLRDRMRTFIHTDYRAYLFMHHQVAIGYALVDHSKSPLYLRQFFIGREYRRQGLGKAAFEWLLQTLRTDELDLEVLVWNEPGVSFWKSMGFKERSVYMKLERDSAY